MKARITSITETGATIKSGWCLDIDKMKEIYESFKKSFPLWVHVLEYAQ